MENHSVSIPIRAWFGDDTLELKFPEDWEVTECRMEGHGTKAIGPNEMREAIENPTGTP